METRFEELGLELENVVGGLFAVDTTDSGTEVCTQVCTEDCGVAAGTRTGTINGSITNLPIKKPATK